MSESNGDAMLDLILCYLILAALDSFLKGNSVLPPWSLHFTFGQIFSSHPGWSYRHRDVCHLKMAATMNFSVGLSFKTDGYPLTASEGLRRDIYPGIGSFKRSDRRTFCS